MQKVTCSFDVTVATFSSSNLSFLMSEKFRTLTLDVLTKASIVLSTSKDRFSKKLLKIYEERKSKHLKLPARLCDLADS